MSMYRNSKMYNYQIKNSTRFVNYKDLKEVYKTTTKEITLDNLDKFEKIE